MRVKPRVEQDFVVDGTVLLCDKIFVIGYQIAVKTRDENQRVELGNWPRVWQWKYEISKTPHDSSS